MAPVRKKMKTMDKDIFYLILQFLDENNYTNTLHTLERESRIFFRMEHFEDLVTNGDLDEAEKYLSAFINIGDNNWSTLTIFLLRRLKYYEALDRNDMEKAVETLHKDLKVFANYEKGIYRDFALLLPYFREKKLLTNYVDTKSAREGMLRQLKHLIEGNPLLRDKLHFPVFQNSLRTLVDKGLNGEPEIFNNPKPDLHTKNQFVDHNMGRGPYSINLATSIPNAGDILRKAAHESGYSQALRDVWKPTEISRPIEVSSLRLPDSTLPARIIKLTYTTAGSALLALSYNGVHKLWKWELNQTNGKASAKVVPQLWRPSHGNLMTNEASGINPEEASPCSVLSKNDLYLISASGGKISLYNMATFKTITTFKFPPPAASSVAFHPKNNNVIAIGMDDSTIQIYNVPIDEVISKLEGHQKKVTGLAFSCVLDILVSSDIDSKLCVWGLHEWELRTSKFLQRPSIGVSKFHTRVQFHKNQSTVLAVHETKVVVYEAPKLEVMKQWSPHQESKISAITDATYSCDSESIFVSLNDGRVAVLISETLLMRCLINPSTYMPSKLSNTVYPVAIAAHPSETNQIAIGLTDGGVCVLEPCSSNNEWGNLPPDNRVVDATDALVQIKL